MKSHLTTADIEIAVDETLFRLLSTFRKKAPPKHPLQWAFASLRRLLREQRRKRKRTQPLRENSGAPPHPSPKNLPEQAPGLEDFWNWAEQNRKKIQKKLTKPQFQAFFATKGAATIKEAAARAKLSQRDYRKHKQRAAKKIFELFSAESVPPPLNRVVQNFLNGEQNARKPLQIPC